MSIKTIQFFDDRFYKINTDGKDPIYFPAYHTVMNVAPKPFLAKWRGDIGNREADLRMGESQDKGSRIHHAIYVLLAGGLVIYNPMRAPIYSPAHISELAKQYAELEILRSQQEMIQIMRVKEWMKTVKPLVVESECTVYSMKDETAGTLDNVFAVPAGSYRIAGAKPLGLDKGLYIVDYKSGQQDEDYAIQVSAYAKWYEETDTEQPVPLGYDKKIAGCLLIYTDASTKGGIAGLTTRLITREEMEDHYKTFLIYRNLWQIKHGDMVPNVFEIPSQLTLEDKKEEQANG